MIPKTYRITTNTIKLNSSNSSYHFQIFNPSIPSDSVAFPTARTEDKNQLMELIYAIQSKESTIKNIDGTKECKNMRMTVASSIQSMVIHGSQFV